MEAETRPAIPRAMEAHGTDLLRRIPPDQRDCQGRRTGHEYTARTCGRGRRVLGNHIGGFRLGTRGYRGAAEVLEAAAGEYNHFRCYARGSEFQAADRQWEREDRTCYHQDGEGHE